MAKWNDGNATPNELGKRGYSGETRWSQLD